MPDDFEKLNTLIQYGWTLVCAGLVLFMQAGFCCVEAGSVRHKNSINVAIKNVVDLCISFPAFYLIGYALMFGATRSGLYGEPVASLSNLQTSQITAFVFQASFCSTAATIVSGGVAERCRFLPYVFVTFAVAILIYPVFGHWVWGGGWLSKLGYHDFAGSSVVHMVGAGVTLAGIVVLGPRHGRFDAKGKAQAVPASSMPLVSLGVMILIFGWIGFNGGSAPLSERTGLIIANTMLAGCVGGLAALLWTWASRGLASVDLILNGLLGGLVAITASADVVNLHAAGLIGLLGGLAVVAATSAMERLKLDDSVGAVPVHGGAGLIGILCTAVFGDAAMFEPAGLTRLQFLGVQALGAGACLLWSTLMGLLAWWLVSKLSPLRAGSLEETLGMNFSEHQVESPVQALTSSLERARAQGLREGDFDHVPDAQFDTLARAIRELVSEQLAQVRRADEWSESLDTISDTLDLNHRVGREALQSYTDELQHLEGSLRTIETHLLQGRVEPTSLALAGNSVTNLRRRLELLNYKLPSALDSWEQVDRMAERIDRITGSMRGNVRETH
jgi:Amt family ammonium transporter